MKWVLPARWGICVLFMDEGLVVEEGTPGEIFENPQQQRTQDFLKKVLK